MSGARPDTWMPIYIGDYLADTMHLSYAEHGAYLLLIFAYWRSGGPLPDSDRELAGICRATPKQWRDMRPTMARFFQVEDGVWRHRRIEQEIIKWQSLKDKRSEAGSAGAAKRWQTDSKRIATDMASEKQTDALNLNLNQKKEKKGAMAPHDVLWSNGISYLCDRGGTSERDARSLIGKWVKASTPETVIDLIARAQAEKVIGPVAFIEACLKRRSPKSGTDPGGYRPMQSGAGG